MDALQGQIAVTSEISARILTLHLESAPERKYLETKLLPVVGGNGRHLVIRISNFPDVLQQIHMFAIFRVEGDRSKFTNLFDWKHL